MDVENLLQCFAGTLEARQDVRERAEAQLREYTRTPGFLGACLDITGAQDAPLVCRKAAAVYFKNRVVRHWNAHDDTIDSSERPVILERLVPVLAAVEVPTKTQLVPVFRKLVSEEYPDNWPNLLPTIGALLQKLGDMSSMYTGVMCFTEVCRYYRWAENPERESQLDPIITQVFPHLLSMGNAILDADLSETSAGILKLILKAYKFVTYYDMPKVLQTKDALVSWGSFHCRVISTDPPAYILSPSLSSEKSQMQISKCYKWAVANVDRLFRRYASRDLSSKRKYSDFREMFLSDFIPHVMSTYLGVIEQWCNGDRWLSNPALYYLLEFLSHCVTQKETWRILHPYFENIVSHFIFPLLCPSEETLELFDSDPTEYINSRIDTLGFSEPDFAALGLLVTLVSKRKKTVADSLVSFALSQLSSLQSQSEDLDVARKKDGALRLLGGISHVLMAENSPYQSQMEAFLSDLVLPNLTSQHEFLQARALDVCSSFADLQIQNDQVLSTLYHGILRSFASDAGDVSLPVSLQSALAVQAYLQQPKFREVLSTIILPTMSKLLELSNQIDNEAVSVVMQECVENFSQQLQPFGVDLMKNLTAQFLRLAAEVKEAVNVEMEDFDRDFNDALSDKITAATGLLNTMITVLLSFENSKETCITLEETFSPAIEYVLVNKLDDFIAEIGELIENSIFLLRAVSPLMWTHFSRLADTFSDGIALMYTEELSVCLKHYMVFGNDFLIQHPDFVNKFLSIIMSIIQGDDGVVDYNEIALTCELGQTLILSLQQNASLIISNLSKTVLPVLASNQTDAAHVKNDSLTVNSVNYVITCLIYDSSTTMSQLTEYQHMSSFFESWIALIPHLRRVYDIKLSILGLMAVSSSADVLNAVSNLVEHLGPKLAVLFRELPKAIKNFELQRADFSASGYSKDELDFGSRNQFSKLQGYDDEISNSDDEDNAHDFSTDKYLDFLNQETSKFANSGSFDDDDNETLFEDVLGSTPLDAIDAFSVFTDYSSSLQANNPALYSAIFDNLKDDEKQAFVQASSTT